MSDRFREEMVQVAAVAAAIVEDLDNGSAGNPRPHDSLRITETQQIESVLRDVMRERYRQNNKWGPQHHDPAVWMAILMEEVGEAADEIPLPGGHQIDLVNLVQSVGSLGAACKVWLERMFDNA